MKIDLDPAFGTDYMTQDYWIQHFNKQEGWFKGKRMLSAADFINSSLYSKKAAESLRDECTFTGEGTGCEMITSTRVSYTKKNYLAEVHHNFGSTVVEPTKLYVRTPHFPGVPLEQVLEDPDGLTFIRQLADDRHATPESLIERIQAVSFAPLDKILVFTPRKKERQYGIPVWFMGREHGFCIDCYYDTAHLSARTRGVKNEEKAEAKQ